MNTPHFTKLVISAAITFALAGCGGDHDDDVKPPPESTVEPGDVFAITASNKLISFNRDSAATVRTSVAVTGLGAGENLVGIDFRPADGVLYGVASTGRLYSIDTSTAIATLKSTLAADAADTTVPFVSLTGTQFGVDFNPVADRLRVISDSGQNLRINVDTGATTTDGVINRAGVAPSVAAAAYTNSILNATTTQLFDVDSASSVLALQNPPNDGTLVNVGPLGVTIAGDGGMDIAGGANGLVLAALRTTDGGPTSLYRVDITTGAGTPIGGATNPTAARIGSGMPGVKDIAIWLR